jgi:hypothetical protein
MARVERQGLCREENLYLFETWYRLGGMQRPPSLMELAEMPAALVKDLGYILGTLGRVRRERKTLRELSKK